MTGKHTETPIGRELIERLTEIAYRDTAQSVTVRAADLRAAVRAVNAHDYLIAAAEKLIAYDDMDPDCSVDMMLAYNEAVMLARAALSAAKE